VKIDRSEHEKIKRMYTKGLVPMARLAERYKVSRYAIYKILKGMGVDTEKKGGIHIVCFTCKKEFTRHKSQLRLRHRHRFCSRECYFKYVNSLKDGEYKQWRHGQRIARKIVSRYHTFLPGEIIHHEDKDDTHNVLGNLKVFASQSDHLKYHRGNTDVAPVWSGVDILNKRLKK
jgi:hypothetical protein